MPERPRRWAVLIGASRFRELGDLPAVRNNLRQLWAVFTDPSLGGIPPDQCIPVPNPGSERDVVEVLHKVSTQAEDTLIVYYAGHGFLDDRADLHLGLPGSARRPLVTGTLPFDKVRDLLLRTRAPTRLLILDCCNSGRAADPVGATGTAAVMGPDDSAIAERVHIDGTCTLTSSDANRVSFAPDGRRLTAFTEHLVRLLRRGVPNGPTELNVQLIYEHLYSSLEASGLPKPQLHARNTCSRLALVRNVAWTPSRPPAEPGAGIRGDEAAEDRPVDPGTAPDLTGEASRPSRRKRRRRRLLLMTVAVAAALVAGSVVLALKQDRDTRTTTVTIAGTSEAGAITSLVAEDFLAENGDVRVDDWEGGWSWQALCQGTLDVMGTSGRQTPDSGAGCDVQSYVELLVGYDAMVFMTNADNLEVSCLSLVDVYSLISGESPPEDWSEAAELAQELGSDTVFPEAPFSFTGQPLGEGHLEDLVIEPIADGRPRSWSNEVRSDYAGIANDVAIVEHVGASTTSLAWMRFTDYVDNATDRVKPLAISARPNGQCVEPNETTITAGTYPLSQALYVNISEASIAANLPVVAMMNSYLDGLSGFVEQAGFVPLSSAQLDATRATWRDRRSALQ